MDKDYIELRTQLTHHKWLIVIMPKVMNEKDWELLRRYVSLLDEGYHYQEGGGDAGVQPDERAAHEEG